MPEAIVSQPQPVVMPAPGGFVPPAQPALPVQPAPSSGSGKWWILAGVLFVIFIGIAVWYFMSR